MRSPGTILFISSDGAHLYGLELALRKSRIENPIHLARYPEEAKCYLSGAGIYRDRSIHPLPQIVLIDLEMPNGAGLETLAWIRRQKDFAGLPVITIGQRNNYSDVQLAFDEGANACFRKGIEMADLADLILNLEFVENLLKTQQEEPPESRR